MCVCVCGLRCGLYKTRGPIISSSLVCPAVSCISTLSHKLHDFRKRILNLKYVLIFVTIDFDSQKTLAQSYHKSSQVFLQITDCSCLILIKFEVSWQIHEKKTKYLISRKSVQRDASCFIPTDRQTWRSLPKFDLSV